MGKGASGAGKYHYLDHDTDVVDEQPPTQNVWYEVFHAYDVRLLYCIVTQSNGETAAKDIQVRWTIDGNIYLVAGSIPNLSVYHVFRDYAPSTGGTAGLIYDTGRRTGAYTTCKRGQDFKVEVRMTSVPGTNQRLRCWSVRETKELT